MSPIVLSVSSACGAMGVAERIGHLADRVIGREAHRVARLERHLRELDEAAQRRASGGSGRSPPRAPRGSRPRRRTGPGTTCRWPPRRCRCPRRSGRPGRCGPCPRCRPGRRVAFAPSRRLARAVVGDLVLAVVERHLHADRRTTWAGRSARAGAIVADARAAQLAVVVVVDEHRRVLDVARRRRSGSPPRPCRSRRAPPSGALSSPGAHTRADLSGRGRSQAWSLAGGHGHQQRAPDAQQHRLDHAALERADADVGEAAAARAGHGRRSRRRRWRRGCQTGCRRATRPRCRTRRPGRRSRGRRRRRNRPRSRRFRRRSCRRRGSPGGPARLRRCGRGAARPVPNVRRMRTSWR
jgi:hypothetical protein